MKSINSDEPDFEIMRQMRHRMGVPLDKMRLAGELMRLRGVVPPYLLGWKDPRRYEPDVREVIEEKKKPGVKRTPEQVKERVERINEKRKLLPTSKPKPQPKPEPTPQPKGDHGEAKGVNLIDFVMPTVPSPQHPKEEKAKPKRFRITAKAMDMGNVEKAVTGEPKPEGSKMSWERVVGMLLALVGIYLTVKIGTWLARRDGK